MPETNKHPKISVLMPVYNCAKYLRQAIDSILAQTFTNFEFLIIDDGSSDGSVEIINSYQDPRIRFIRNEHNLGYIPRLNNGIDLAAGEYLARMDADDISLPQRLERQAAFMDAHPEIAACGTWAQDIDADGRVLATNEKPSGEQLGYEFWRPSPLYHPSAMIRLSQLGEMRYDSAFLFSEDYELWLRLRARYRIDNVPECLLLYRVHEQSVSRKNAEAQLQAAHRAFCRHVGPISFADYCELVGVTQALNPIRRALLSRRLAKTIRQPYGHFLKQDLHYAGQRLDRRLHISWAKWQLLGITYRVWRRLRPHRAKGSANGNAVSR